MAVTNRAAKLAKLHRVAKKHYQPVAPPSDRSVLDHLLYACILEDSKFEDADEAFARLQQGYFDWNEVRVTTAVELAEVLGCVSNANEAAVRLKKTLHSMFETHYTFDIDTLRKENLGKAIQKMERYKGITPFVVSYVAQNGLGGHSIGVDKSLINLMYTIGIIDEKEAAKRIVPGMERAIAKNKGVEFFSLVHQLAVAYTSSPFNNDIRAILLSLDAEAKERFPKRVRKKKKAAAKPEAKAAEKSSSKQEAKTTAKKTAVKKKATKKKAATRKKAATKKKAGSKKTSKKKKTATRKKAAKKKTAAKTAKKKTTKKSTKKKKTTKRPARKKATKKSTASRRLAKKKPR